MPNAKSTPEEDRHLSALHDLEASIRDLIS